MQRLLTPRRISKGTKTSYSYMPSLHRAAWFIYVTKHTFSRTCMHACPGLQQLAKFHPRPTYCPILKSSQETSYMHEPSSSLSSCTTQIKVVFLTRTSAIQYPAGLGATSTLAYTLVLQHQGVGPPLL